MKIMDFRKINEDRLAWQDIRRANTFSNKESGFKLVEMLQAVVMGVVYHILQIRLSFLRMSRGGSAPMHVSRPQEILVLL